MLEPNLKNGAGGLRDVQAPGWVGWALPGRRRRRRPARRSGLGRRRGACWSRAGYLQPGDPAAAARRPRAAPRRARRAPPGHRRSVRPAPAPGPGRGRRARRRGRRRRAGAQRSARRRAPSCGSPATSGPGCWRPRPARPASAAASRDLGDGVVLRDGRIAFDADATTRHRDRCCAPRRTRRALRVPFERATLARLAAAAPRSSGTPRPATRSSTLLARRARRDPGVRDPRPRRAARAAAPGVGARAGASATQRVPPVHRRPALARSGGRVRGAARSRRSRRVPGFDGDVARAARARRAAPRRAAPRHRQGSSR